MSESAAVYNQEDALQDWSLLLDLAGDHAPAVDFLVHGLRCLPPQSEAAGSAADRIFSSLCQRVPGLHGCGWVWGQKGLWQWLGQSCGAGAEVQSVDLEWLGSVLDAEQPGLDFPFSAMPLRAQSRRGQLLVARWAEPQAAAAWMPQAVAWSAAVECLLALDQQIDGTRQEARHLLQLLDFTSTWNRSRDTDSLLRQIAETSTQWIPCERATIFLWDRANHQLVGRPALGIDGDPLLVPDDAGLVGQVVQTGQPGRVDEGVPGEQAQVDRRTDQRLKFQTRSLLCVPLWDEQGHCVGAFELINRREGNFTEYDQRSLQQLAKHAAIAISNLSRVERLETTQKAAATQAAAAVQMRGSSPLIQTLRNSLARVAATDLTVLLLGENGTGKEVAAQLLHYQSQRRNEVLIAVNCAAIPENLLESELFGHEKGAFTDAVETRAGKFELASQGTIFLDEIGDMSLSGQAKLLRVLEEKTIVRVGGSQSILTNARVVAATNQDLADLVRKRQFREDLFFRLNVVTLEIPPLRLRGDDVWELADFFLETFCRQARRDVPRFAPDARRLLREHPWPGNVRELRNMMERLAFLSSGDVIAASDLSFIVWPGSQARIDDSRLQLDWDLPLPDATRHFQTQYIHQQIDRAGGNMTLAAQQLGLHRTNLYRKMKQLGMDCDSATG